MARHARFAPVRRLASSRAPGADKAAGAFACAAVGAVAAAPQATLRSAVRHAVLPLGALAAGFGLSSLAMAQVPAPASAASAPAAPEASLRKITVKGQQEESGRDTLKANTTRIGKGTQELRDVPQSITVVTEKLLLDRNQDTLKDALRNTAGISFQAAEGGEEDIRLRGFSLQATGDIFIDGMRDPAFYERDAFNWDRLEVLRGSASMLFGRGSTGGAVNQVSKQPLLVTRSEVNVTLGTGDYLRGTGDFNIVTGDNAALRITSMNTQATNDGAGTSLDKEGFAAAYAWGIGTRDEFQVGVYHLANRNGINYGLPWIEGNTAGVNHLWPTDPKNYYGAASDRNNGGVDYGSLMHVHRFAGGGELRTQARYAEYTRDLRASAIRFADTDPVAAGNQPPTNATFSNSTVLTRGNQIKIQDMRTQYVQSDYSNKFGWFGLQHSVLTGVDAAHEGFNNYGGNALPKPTTTVGTPSDGGGVNEADRNTFVNRKFDAKALGVYAQDLVRLAPSWKVLGGLRWDRFQGRYDNIAVAPGNNVCGLPVNARVERSDSLWSKRAGVMYQPTPLSSYHFSYGTSFNTSGDAYQYDAGNVNTGPESSRNLELGAKLDSESGQATARFALFHATKYNERNRDADTVNACNYVLSGKRHAAGVEVDLAGRLTPAWEIFVSYAFIPQAKVDSSSGAAGTEAVGSRPGLTPRHTGTLWTTYQLTPAFRFGGGVNARSSDTPVGLAASSPLYAPKFITADLMAEYALNRDLAFKLNMTNVTNKHYANMLYRGHYIPGKGRTVQLTGTYKF